MTRRFAATIRFLSLAASAALLTACAFDQPAQQETKTGWRPHFEIEAEQMKRFEAERDRIGERLRAACVSPKYKPYFAKTACLPAGITDQMTTDQTRITAAQKQAAKAVFELSHELSEEMRDFMVNTGLPALIDQAEGSRRRTDPLIEDLQNRLLSGQITWGQYNSERRYLADRAREDAASRQDSDS